MSNTASINIFQSRLSISNQQPQYRQRHQEEQKRQPCQRKIHHSENQKRKKATARPQHQPAGASNWDSSDDDFDCQPVEKFPIGAQLPLSNKPYDMINVKREVLKENTKNDISIKKTRKPIRTLTNRKNKTSKEAPLVLVKYRFKDTQSTINAKLG